MAERICIGDYLLEYSQFSGYTIIAYLGKEKHVTVPETFEGEPVAYVGRFAFSPKNAYISEEQRAFLKNSLESVTFKKHHLKELIEKGSFYVFTFAGCQGLKAPIDTEFLTESDGYRCYPIRHMPVFFYPDCPHILPKEAKGEKDGILKDSANSLFGYTIAVSGNYHTIGEGVFYHKNATSVYLSEGVERIEAAAFADIPDLQEVYLPSTLRYVAPNAFANCPSLSEESRAALAAYITENPLTATIEYVRIKNETASLAKKKTFEITVCDVTASHEFVMLTLTENAATLLLRKTGTILTLPLGEEVSVRHNDYDMGSIIEGERYYERDDVIDYTFKLINVQ